MRRFVKKLRPTAMLILLTCLPVQHVSGQQPLPPPGSVDPITGVERVPDPMMDKLHKQQAKAMNDLRQKQLVADTDKLLQLATELKAEVAKTDKETLSVTVIKKTDEIEKLAKSVRQKMKAGQ